MGIYYFKISWHTMTLACLIVYALTLFDGRSLMRQSLHRVKDASLPELGLAKGQLAKIASRNKQKCYGESCGGDVGRAKCVVCQKPGEDGHPVDSLGGRLGLGPGKGASSALFCVFNVNVG